MAGKEGAEGLTDILDQFDDAAEGGATFGDVLDQFENRSLGALLTLIGLVAALPVIGAIPGVSIVTGALILLAIGQSLIGRGGLWLPERLRERVVPRDKLDKAVGVARPWAKRVDSVLKPRLSALVARGPVSVVAALLAVTFLPLAVVPFGVQAPAMGVMFLGLALVGRDGAFAALGYALGLVTLWVIWAFAL